MEIRYFVAGIDLHKSMLAVVIADVGREGELGFEQRKFGTTPGEWKLLRAWLTEQGVREAVRESTAQHWKPVWQGWRGPASYCWARHTPIARREVARGILPMPSAC